MLTGEYWLNKVGIGLLLFGLAFGFKYSVDQGWLIPEVRIACGLGLGLLLLILGLRMHEKRRPFSQVLIGGSVATFYITGFSAFQLFELVPYTVAMGFMVAVTLLAFVLSLRQDEAVLSLIGALGGLGTPFLLYTGASNVPGLMGYLCLLLAGTGAMYFYKGWRSLLTVTYIGGWIVVFIGVSEVAGSIFKVSPDRWPVQLAVLFAWFVFWMVPVLREIATAANPERWLRPGFGLGDRLFTPEVRGFLNRHVYLLSLSTPLLAVWTSGIIWSLTEHDAGWGFLIAAAVHGLAALGVSRWKQLSGLAFANVISALVLFTMGIGLLLKGDALCLVVGLEAAALTAIAHRTKSTGLAVAGHLAYLLTAGILVDRIAWTSAKTPAIWNIKAGVDLLIILLAAGVSRWVTHDHVKQAYRVLAHLAILGLMLRELSAFTDGQGYVTIAWGMYAVALLVAGLRLNYPRLRTLALATLMLVVAKLFLVDLSKLETIWRVLLFMGFGGLFLFVSYFFRSMWRADPEDRPESE